MKTHIAIVAGGDSSEYTVSLKSAEGIKSFLDADIYEPYVVVIRREGWQVILPDGTAAIDKNDFSFIEDGQRKGFDFAYITIHGTPGEDGLLQGYFDLIGMPYSSCNTLAAALTYNKYACNNFLRGFADIYVPPSVCIRKKDSFDRRCLLACIPLPFFVKPNTGGSSFGVTKVREAEQLSQAIEKAFAESDEILVEQAVEGAEVTCGCYKIKDREVIFPITEIVSHNEIFDYDAKYNGQSEEITPARIPEDTAEKVRRITSEVYDLIRAKGLIRIDYIVNREGNPVLLDVNTTPGMTPASLIPQQAKAAGMDMKSILKDIIENELNQA